MLELVSFFLLVCVATAVIARPSTALYLLPLAIVFSPEFVIAGSAGASDISTPVFLTFDDSISLGLFIWLIHNRGFRIYRVWLLAVLFVVVASVATTIGIVAESVETPVLAIFWILKLMQYFFVGFVVSLIVHYRSDVHRIIIGLVCVTIVSLISIPVLFDSFRTTYPFMGPQESGVISGMLTTLFVALSLYSPYRKMIRYRALLMICAITGSVYVILSGSRAGLFGMIIGILYVLMSEKSLYQRLKITVISVPTGACLFALGIISDNSAVTRQVKTVQKLFTLQFSAINSLSARFDKSWQSIMRWAENPILGVGMPIGWVDNWYVRVLTETGVIGFVIWIYLLAVLFRNILAADDDPLISSYVTGITGALLVMVVASLFGARFVTVNTGMLFWFLSGTGLGIAFRHNDITYTSNYHFTFK